MTITYNTNPLIQAEDGQVVYDHLNNREYVIGGMMSERPYEYGESHDYNQLPAVLP